MCNLEVDEALIPTGRGVSVEGTPLDLTKPTRLGEVFTIPLLEKDIPPSEGAGQVSWW